MKKGRNTLAEAADLRRRAENRLRAGTTKDPLVRTEPEAQKFVHELQVHQIELEMQSEELWQSRAEAEAGLEHYTELYDFAPMGYLTLGREGGISKVNLAGAELLGVERACLVGRRFGNFVDEPDKAGFKAFLGKVFASQAKEVCEVALQNHRQRPLNVHITAKVAQDGHECRLMMVELTELRQTDSTQSAASCRRSQNLKETGVLAMNI